MSPRGWALLHGRPVVRVDASMHGCRTEFTQGGVNRFEDYQVLPPTPTFRFTVHVCRMIKWERGYSSLAELV